MTDSQPPTTGYSPYVPPPEPHGEHPYAVAVPSSPPPRRPGRGLTIAGIIVCCLALPPVLCGGLSLVTGGAQGLQGGYDAFSKEVEVPGSVTVELEPAEYDLSVVGTHLYDTETYTTGTGDNRRTRTRHVAISFTEPEVIVVGPSGEVPLTDESRGFGHHEGDDTAHLHTFEVAEAGEYTITTEGDGRDVHTVLLEKQPSPGFIAGVLGIACLVVGALPLVAGAVLLFSGRRSARRAT